jgi:hypothetical protein
LGPVYGGQAAHQEDGGVGVDGKLIAAQGKRRLYWEFGSLTLSGVTGISGANQYIADPVVDDIAIRAIKALAQEPHGVFFVDMTYDEEDVPNVTEVNAGRFGSSGIVHSHTDGHNFPYLAVQVALGEQPRMELPLLNPLNQDMVLIHGIDIIPVVADLVELDRCEKDLERRRTALLALV